MIGDAGISAICSNRVYPGPVPLRAVLPAIGYERISTETDLTHDGDSDFESPRFQIRIVGNTYPEMKGLGDAVVAFWNGRRGTVGTVQVDGSYIANRRDGDIDDEPVGFVEYIDVIVPHRT